MTNVSIIVAVAKNRAIGKNNQLLWNIPEDLQHFKEITLGHPVIMGQRTYESIGRPLPKRQNIILTQDKNLKIDGVDICYSLPEAIELAKSYDKDEVFIIGGGSVYAQAIDFADKLYLTLVDEEFDADVFFPEYKSFKMIKEEPWQDSNGLKYRFTEWERIK